jgi:hypothetical protein
MRTFDIHKRQKNATTRANVRLSRRTMPDCHYKTGCQWFGELYFNFLYYVQFSVTPPETDNTAVQLTQYIPRNFIENSEYFRFPCVDNISFQADHFYPSRRRTSFPGNTRESTARGRSTASLIKKGAEGGARRPSFSHHVHRLERGSPFY